MDYTTYKKTKVQQLNNTNEYQTIFKYTYKDTKYHPIYINISSAPQQKILQTNGDV